LFKLDKYSKLDTYYIQDNVYLQL